MFQKFSQKVLALSVAAMCAVPAFAQTAADPIGDMLDAVNLSGVAAKVIAAGILVVGIALAFKAPDLAKRVTKKV